jgi:homogentisate phytyltransferase/homogentisate geranylgeranyltransferase
MSKFVQGILQMANRVISGIEDTRVPFVCFVFTFLFAVTIRNFLEPFSTHDIISSVRYTHYYLFHILLASTLIVLLRIATQSPLKKVARVVLVSYIIVIIPPLLDLLITRGAGLWETYLVPGAHSQLLLRFFTFFGEFKDLGVTFGQRVEIGLALVGCFLYVCAKRRSLIRGIWYTFLAYAIIFCYFITPFIFKVITELIGFVYVYSDKLFINFYCVISILVGIVLAILANRQYFLIILRDMRLLRVLYFLSIFAVGIALGLSAAAFGITLDKVFHFIFIAFSIVCAFMYSVITNNFADYEIDKISNPGRPLFNATINIEVYQRLAWLFLGLALFYAAIVNFTTLFLMALFIGNYYLYSIPPIRFKRVPFFSKLAISINALALTMLGFFTITGQVYGVPSIQYPSIIFPIYLIGFTAMANVIDIKDYLGDKQSGIKTLPVILGLSRAKIVIGLFFVLTYGALYFVVQYLGAPLYWFFIIMGLGIVQFILINWRRYIESAVFVVMLVTIWLLIYLIFLYM